MLFPQLAAHTALQSCLTGDMHMAFTQDASRGQVGPSFRSGMLLFSKMVAGSRREVYNKVPVKNGIFQVGDGH